MKLDRKVTLITGASAGIGADLARVCARHGHDLALVGRSGERLEALAAELSGPDRPKPIVLAVDLTEPGAGAALAAVLEAEGASPDILVNNAGFGLLGGAADLDPAEQLAIIDLNIRALVEITLQFLPAIRAAKGKILNVASVASYISGGPGMAVYYASKSFVLSFTLALRQELHGEGVGVTALCPGATKTQFQVRAGFEPQTGLARFHGPTSFEVAEAGYKGLIAGRREIVPGLTNRILVSVLPFLPKSLILTLISQLQHSRRGSP